MTVTARLGRALHRDLSLSAVLAGLVATLISYAGPLLIIFQVADSNNMPPAMLTSWIWAISIGSGVLGIVLSLYYRVPVIIAWSAPGSALLLTLLGDISMAQAVGAYLLTAVMLLLLGLTGAFDRLLKRLPPAIAAAMLAGILLQFGLGVFAAAKQSPLLVLSMLASYLLAKRLLPRYAIVLVLLSGIAVSGLTGQLQLSSLSWQLAQPVWTTPEFSLSAFLNVSLPLLLVALTGQFVPGMAVLTSAGYTPPASPLLTSSAIGSALLAPFGCHGLNLAAITAAICTGPDAHPDPAKRYIAGISGGLAYLLLGLFGATLVSLFGAFSPAFIAALAGLALFTALAAAFNTAMAPLHSREPALITFLVTASGVSLWGLASAFWGLIFGLTAYAVIHWRQQP